ncbi:GRF1-interacting factor 2-like [Pyrus x bretschneideri]|uniref:GRF1-interacting factor 2-like n=1 Tax=Pyrus x bretschneideri TaxID=225117 RepID=UPI002030E566|nr:GRF1-interacting factor 2-like [Pyrus x bretschneideri]
MNVWHMNDVQEETFNKATYPALNWVVNQSSPIKYLDDNKKLVMAILDNRNLGKLAECAQYQAQLQKNMIYLAAIADAQPLSPAVPAQMAPHPAMQQAGYYMRHAQAAAMAQQQGIFPPKMPMQFNNMHQMHDPRQQQQLHQQNQQAMQGQMGMRPRGASGMPSMHYTEGSFGGGSGGPNSAGGPNDGCEGSKQDASDPRVGGDGQGSSAGGHGNGAGMTASELALKDDSTWKHVPVDSRYFPKVAVVLGDV